jgi:SAM-dependent methyltransferase
MLSNDWRDKFIARNVDYSVITSKKLERAVVKLCPYAQTSVIYGAVDTKAYEGEIDKNKLREELQLPVDKFLVGYVGLYLTMGMEKGISTMIESLKFLDKDCLMVFVGGKPKEIEMYQELARDKGVLDRCIFLPIQPFDKVVKYERAMDALVIPYPDQPHFRNYGFPMKIYEYLASGTPMIYTKLELPEEVASDCAYGIIPDSPEDMARGINEVKSKPEEAKRLALLARKKAEKYTWHERTKKILEVCRIIEGTMNIPNEALKYILFQRTEFSIYTTYRSLLRLVMNRRIPIYNLSVNVEAFLFKNRTKKLFSADMEREYSIIKDHLPGGVDQSKNILDIGCGVAGIDILLARHYKNAKFYLLDKSHINSRVYYGIEKEAAYYNSLGIAKKMLVANGVAENNVFLQEVTGAPIFPGKKFDLIISLISWGFHYPISTYLDEVYNSLGPGGILIVDVRKDTDGEHLLKEKFGQYHIIYEAQKYRRLLIQK